mgnify:CR=1 FL=1
MGISDLAKNRKFATLALASSMLLGDLAGAGVAQAQDALDSIEARGSLRLVGVSFPPYMVASADGSYSGIDYEMLSGFADSLGVKLEIVPGTWGTAIAGVQSGKWDIAPVMCWKPERVEAVTFSETYYQGGLVAAVYGDGPKTLEEMNDPSVTIVFPAGTFKETFVEKFFPKAKTNKITDGSTAQVLLELMSGRGNATLLDAPIDISKVEAAYPGKFTYLPSKVTRLPDTTCLGSYIVKRDAYHLAAKLNDYVKMMKSTAKLQDLYDKNIKVVLEGDK